MWKAKDFITLLMVVILVALIVINTWELNLTSPRGSPGNSTSTRQPNHQATRRLPAGGGGGGGDQKSSSSKTSPDGSGATTNNFKMNDAGQQSASITSDQSTDRGAATRPGERLQADQPADDGDDDDADFYYGKRADRTNAGQLETFSAEATGLGDMEGADELKKMLKRSAGWRASELAPVDGIDQHEEPDDLAAIIMKRRGQARQASIGRDLAQLVALYNTDQSDGNEQRDHLRAGRREEASEGDGPRAEINYLNDLSWPPDGPRQVEQVGELDGSGGSGVTALEGDGGDSYETAGVVTHPIMGEFGSKISLLTMRKDPEPTNGAGRQNNLGQELAARQQLDSETNRGTDNQARQGGADALATIKRLIKLLSGKRNSTAIETPDPLIEISLDPNNLPRIARAFM